MLILLPAAWADDSVLFGGGASHGGKYDWVAQGDSLSNTLTGAANGGVDLGWSPIEEVLLTARPRVAWSGPEWGAAFWAEELSVGLRVAHRRLVLRAGIQRADLGFEAADGWNNGLSASSRLRTTHPVPQFLGGSAEISTDATWDFAMFSGATAPRPGWSTGGARPADGPFTLGTWVTTNQVAFEFRAGAYYTNADHRLVGDLAMSFYPLDVLSLSTEMVSHLDLEEGGPWPPEGAAQLQLELFPHASFRLAGRVEGGWEDRVGGFSAGGGAAFVSSDFNLRVQVLGLRDLESINGREPTQQTRIAADVTLWFGYPQARNEANMDPTRSQYFSAPRRIFGEQP